jgi:DNA-binding response OmpR family regulator
LHAEGFAVLCATDGRTAVELALGERPDLVLLDLNLPRLSGLEVFREIRSQIDLPIIMLTARSGEVDRVVGLELGADDYVSKPYSPREVVARVKTILRRRAVPEAPPKKSEHDVLSVGELSMDRTTHEVTRAEKSIKVTPMEYRILEIFLDNPGRVFTRDHLIELISSDSSEVFDRTLDRHVANLRAKIEVEPQRPHYIVTVYGVGYKLADPA